MDRTKSWRKKKEKRKKKKKERKMNIDNPIKHPLRGSLIKGRNENEIIRKDKPFKYGKSSERTTVQHARKGKYDERTVG